MQKIALILSVSVLASVLAGCDNPCPTGEKLKADVAALEVEVTGTITTPDAFDLTCQRFDTVDRKMLTAGATFALKVASDVLAWTETRCTLWTTENRCMGWNAPTGTPDPGNVPFPQTDPWNGEWMNGYCRKERVCAQSVEVPHLREGHDDALELSSDLTDAAADLQQACVDHAAGDQAKALLALVQVKADLHESVAKADAVLTKAGCSARSGD